MSPRLNGLKAVAIDGAARGNAIRLVPDAADAGSLSSFDTYKVGTASHSNDIGGLGLLKCPTVSRSPDTPHLLKRIASSAVAFACAGRKAHRDANTADLDGGDA